jgi:CRP-like cAMP-binding protein
MSSPEPTELRSVPIFVTLSEDELSLVESLMTSESYSAGRSIVREGDVGYEFFVIKEGTVDVTVGAEVVRRLGPGDFFGEMGIASHDGKRTATVTARTDAVVWSMLGPSLRLVEEQHPEVASKVQAAVGERKSKQ